MKAMIFAAGLGTRLKPLTDTMPKALVPVEGKPLLQHAIEKLKAAGFNEIIVNVHHFAEQIIDFVEENDRFGVRIEFSDEREKLLDTGGAIKKASSFFDDGKPFLVHNVDILSNIDLRALYEAGSKEHGNLQTKERLPFQELHEAGWQDNSTLDAADRSSVQVQQCPLLATLVCSERATTRYLLFDQDNHLKGWTNKATGEVKSPLPDFNPKHYRELAFAGIQLLHPTIFQYMTAFPNRFSIIDFYLSVCDKAEISCHVPDNLKIMDVGKADSLHEATLFLEQLSR